MDNWFTIEEIDDKAYAISEYMHWDHIGGHKYFKDIFVYMRKRINIFIQEI
ncbi:MAG: hypothetical protein GX129_06605 [Clostridiales bacterium]|jgi:hypothetical protein|nr:hypothetical protein [Clostridiales bacterium]